MDMRKDTEMAATTESPESRLYAAGFTRWLEYWVAPDNEQALSIQDAIARLDSGDIKPTSHGFPDTGVRAFPDELVDRVCPQPATEAPPPPPWLLAQADVIAGATAEKMKPLIRAEVRAALRAEARKEAREARQ
jgi:hypothetical protein